MNPEAKSLGIQVNWLTTKIQTTDFFFPPGSYVSVASDNVEVIESFTYLGVDIHNTGSTEYISKSIATARNCVSSLGRNNWHSSITLATKLRLYRVFILPVILYGAETTIEKHRCIWSVVLALHAMNFPEGQHFRWRGPQTYWPATTDESFLATLHVLIHLWTTAEHSGSMWPPYQGIGTAYQADLVKVALHSLIWCHST